MEELLSRLACPETGCTELSFEGDPEGEGVIRTAEGRVYPVIMGVPRMLPGDLLKPFMEQRDPSFGDRWPEFDLWLADAPTPDQAKLDTLLAYSFQHVDLGNQRAREDDWHGALARFLDGIDLESFRDDAVLDVGCGGGGQAYAMAPYAKVVIGLDLSCGFENILKFDRHPNRFYVQGDLMRPPFRPGAFDAMYSHGVLHHTPDPTASFNAVAPLVRKGGRIMAWVYGLDEMRLSYRISHLTWLRPISNHMPRAIKLAMSGAITAGLEAAVWTPARVLSALGAESLAQRIPYGDSADQRLDEKFRRVFDRFNPPITFYMSRADLENWAHDLGKPEIRSADGRGWYFRVTPT